MSRLIVQEVEKQPRRGDIFWVEPSPYHEGSKNVIRGNRPAVIVSADSINRLNFNLEVVFLTTKPKIEHPTYCTIRSAPRPSTAICGQIQTVSYEQIREFVGTCTQEEMATIERCMMTSLGIDMGIPSVAQEPEPDQPEDTEVFNLRIQLARARHGEELMKEMYESLLARTMRLDSPENYGKMTARKQK